MSKISILNGTENEEVLSKIFNQDLVIFEDVQGSKIWVTFTGDTFLIRSKSLNNDPLSMVDLAMQNYYNPAVNYFNSLDDRIKSLMPNNGVVQLRKFKMCYFFVASVVFK